MVSTNGVVSHRTHRLSRFPVECLNINFHKSFTSMASTAEHYSEAILFMLDSMSPTERIQLKDDMRLKLLRWLEATADYSMVLDWPTYAMVRYGFDPVTGECLHPSLKSFRDCLTGSLDNHDFFIRNRKEGATKFLNVLQVVGFMVRCLVIQCQWMVVRAHPLLVMALNMLHLLDLVVVL